VGEEQCVYLGNLTGREHEGHETYDCQIHGQCAKGKVHKIATCHQCKEKLLLSSSDFLDKWVDPLHVTDRFRMKTDALRGMLAGASVVLACGGPSANESPLERLSSRGVWTMAVNNMAGHKAFRPQAFVCSDGLSKFSHSIWMDPGIMKFIPTPKFHRHRNELRRKKENGTFEKLSTRVPACPNLWGFRRRSWLEPDDSFFLDDDASWGNLNDGVRRTGQPKTVCTMLLAIRLIRYLGAKALFLVGVDFYMTPEYGYSFEQGRTEEASVSNNEQFCIVNKWLCKLEEEVFTRFGLQIYNCNERSGLRAFPYVDFDSALKQCQGVVETTPDLSHWYEK